MADNKHPPLPNSYWVKPGRFAAGEYPGAKEPELAATKLKTLLDTGINHFIDLTEPGEPTPSGELRPYTEIAQEQARSLGRTVVCERHPVIDASVPSSPEQMAGILDAIDAALADGKAVYVHCWGGVGRTGTVVGCWLVRHGYKGDAALCQIAEWWREVEKFYWSPNSPETRKQRAYVRNWAEPSLGG